MTTMIASVRSVWRLIVTGVPISRTAMTVSSEALTANTRQKSGNRVFVTGDDSSASPSPHPLGSAGSTRRNHDRHPRLGIKFLGEPAVEPAAPAARRGADDDHVCGF